MRRVTVLAFLVFIYATAAVATAQTQTARPYPTAATPKAVDLGETTKQGEATPISVTIVLKLSNIKEAENLLVSLHTPGDPQYQHFLTASQFVARFGPVPSQVAKVTAGLAKYGLKAERTSATTLRVTGLPADIERAFRVSLHSYEVPGHGRVSGYRYHAPSTRATLPEELSGAVTAVAGLDDRPLLHPMHHAAPENLARAKTNAPRTAAGNPFGYLTVTDFVNQYNVQPLYNSGITGKGRTIGILTFASFTPSDAFAYWSAVGLSVDPKRITIVDVDGGPGAPSDASGSSETTLDVEQAGGIAPDAKIIVYQAPNTAQGTIDLFSTFVNDNIADSLSLSWGGWEWFYNLDNFPVLDPHTGKTISALQAQHEFLVRAAIQGQTAITASGDSGAYEADRDFGYCYPTDCSLALSVSAFASDTAITAAGGTTLPGQQLYCLNADCTPPYYVVNIAQESVWGWDYLDGLCSYLGYDPISCGIFPAGGGGGVSVYFQKPLYQFFVPGVQRSQAGQSFSYDGQLLFNLPANYPGRNLPDISFNSDPNTGYQIYYTSDVNGFQILTYYGGTSFAAPQLNGVAALLGQSVRGHRIGLLNYPLYWLAQTGRAYKGPRAPMHAISSGDNWFYFGSNGYNPGAGLGTLDVTKFSDYLRHPF